MPYFRDLPVYTYTYMNIVRLCSSTSGCTDHFAATEEEGFSLGRDVVTSFNLTPREEPSGFEEPLYDVEELEGLIPEHNLHEMDSYQVRV